MKRQSFQKDWLFGKEGEEKRTITLPHDAMQEEKRSGDAPSGTGCAFFPGGSYLYEKHFFAPQEWKEQTQMLEFEGVYPNAEVLLNGKMLGGCRYGYSDFYVPLNSLQYGAENVLEVRVDNTKTPNSRWYSGAGIYRPVWLWTGAKEHLLPDAVRVTTLDYRTGTIRVDVDTSEENDLKIEIYQEHEKITEAAGNHVELSIENPKLWSAEHPFLYAAKVFLLNGEEVLDSSETTFGIRQISYSSQGFFINGESVLLKGGCMHHDNGILGARSFAASEWRRVQRLKEFGFNAIRSAHNPLCRAALDACDALGMYVMDEAWDMWDKPKNKYDYALEFPEHYEEDLRRMTAKDYNHPSVVMYSIGNEVTEPSKPKGVALAEKLVQAVKRYDTTRPVTAGINLTLLLLASMGIDLTVSNSDTVTQDQEEKKKMNSTEYNKMVSEQGKSLVQAAAAPAADQISSPVLDLLDICGYNYAMSRYEIEKDLHPERVIVGSETYAQDLASSWKLVEEKPYIIGDFMWTAWDYIGEVGIGSWSYVHGEGGFEKKYPWLLADTGALDILGNDTAEAGLAAVVWKARKTPYLAAAPANHPGIEPAKAIWRGTNALPSWSYQGCEGNPTELQVYADGAETEVFVNGRSLGRKEITEYTAVYETAYEKGNVEAVVYDAEGRETGRTKLQSADGPVQIQLRKEDIPMKETSEEKNILYVAVELVGTNGVVECNADETLKISVEGGELLAFGSANPRTEESFLDGVYRTYYGRSLAVIRAEAAEIRVTVQGETLGKTEEMIQV